MQLIRAIATLFTGSEKMRITLVALLRVSLVALDLIGIVLIGAVASLVAGTNISPVSLFGQVLNWFDRQGIQNSYAIIFGAALLFFIAKGVLSVALINSTSRYMATLETRVAERVFLGILSSSVESARTSKREDVVFAATHSVAAATTKAILVGSAILSESALLLIISAFLACTNIWLFLEISLFFGLVAWLLHKYVTVASGQAAKAMHESLLVTQSTLYGTLDNRKQLFLSRNQGTLVELFTRDRKAFSRQNARYQTLTTLPRYITEVAVILGGAILVSQRSLSVDGSVTAPVIAIFIAAIFRIVASMVPIQAALGTWKAIEFEAQPALEFVVGNRNHTNVATLEETGSPLEGKITLRDVSFTFPRSTRPTLSNLNMTLELGSFIGLIGRSGSGKSTFADLLIGLKEPTSGRLEIDGQPLANFLQSNLGYAAYVPQAPAIFPGTLRENISLNFGAPVEGELENVQRVLEMVGLDRISEESHKKLEAPLGAGNRILSGGEIQRIGLARALFENPKLLVLDEITSALDHENQLRILETIESLKGAVTLVVIAHKLETLRAADFVYKLDSGFMSQVSVGSQ